MKELNILINYWISNKVLVQKIKVEPIRKQCAQIAIQGQKINKNLIKFDSS